MWWGDTLHVQPSDLDIAHLQTGNYSYLIVRQKAKDSPAMNMILAKMSVDRISYHGRPEQRAIPDSVRKFWIAKKTKEALKEEDHGANWGYRYKYKLGVSGGMPGTDVGENR